MKPEKRRISKGFEVTLTSWCCWDALNERTEVRRDSLCREVSRGLKGTSTLQANTYQKSLNASNTIHLAIKLFPMFLIYIFPTLRTGLRSTYVIFCLMCNPGLPWLLGTGGQPCGTLGWLCVMVACLSVSLVNNARKYKYEALAKGMSIQPYQFEPEYSLSEENAEENFSGSEQHGINSLKPNRRRERVSRFDNVSKCVYERCIVPINIIIINSASLRYLKKLFVGFSQDPFLHECNLFLFCPIFEFRKGFSCLDDKIVVFLGECKPEAIHSLGCKHAFS